MTESRGEFEGLFGDLLRSLRKSRRARQVDITTAIGVDMTVLSKWENGAILPSIGQLHELRKGLKLNDEEFDLLRFAWFRETQNVPAVYLPKSLQPQGIIESLTLSIDAVRR